MKQRDATTRLTLRHWLSSCTPSERETISHVWHVPAPAASDSGSATTLADTLLTTDAVNWVLAGLAAPERAALERVLAEGDSIPAAVLEREFGAVRLQSHNHYPNPRAYLLALQQPPSPTERLFILGLLQIDQKGWMRHYYVPTDVRPLLPPVPPRDRTLRLTASSAPPIIVESRPWELEHNIGTILALAQAGDLAVVPERGINKASLVKLAKRWGMSKDDLRGLTYEQHWSYVHFLRQVLQGAGLLRVTADQELRPTAATITWLQAPRLERLRQLAQGWVESQWDEMRRFLGLEIKGYAVDRDQAATRQATLAMLAQAPVGKWVSWETLLTEVQRADPDFVRTNGLYDSWKLVNYRGEKLDGYEHWRDVEGELLKASIGGSLRWLGLTDYGGSEDQRDSDHSIPTSFRLTALGAAVLGVAPAPAEEAYEPIVVQPNFEVVVPPRAAPFARFQLGRVAAWASGNGSDEAEVYKLTKASVQAAAGQQINAEVIARFLEDAGGVELPPNVAYSLREWSGQHGQLTIRRAAVLQADDPLLFEQLRRDRRLRLPKVEPLNEETWLMDEGDGVALAQALRKAGYGLAGDVETSGPELKERDFSILAGALKFYVYACHQLRIEGDASNAMIQRFAKLLTQRQRDTADRIAYETLDALKKRLK